MKEPWCPRADESLLQELDSDRAAFEREFREMNGYPLPWCEVVSVEDVETLSWSIGQRAGMGLPTIRMQHTLEFLLRRMPGKTPEAEGSFRGWTEPIDDAVKRLTVPTDGVVVVLSLWRGLTREDGARGLRIHMKSVVEGHFWNDDTFVVDEDANWVLCGPHDDPAYFWQFSKPK